MSAAGLLNLLLCTYMVLAAIVSAERSPQITKAGVVRQKRQFIFYETIWENRRRIANVEENVKRTESAVENISEHLAALGFQLHPNEENWQRSQNPCDKYSHGNLQGQNEMPWTLWGNSKCVKLLSGLSTFSDATARCRQQHAKGQDIGYPAVVSFDSSNNAASLVPFLRERLDGSSLWVGRRSLLPLLNCTEMKVTNSSTEQVEWKGVDCGVLNRVVCEKPLPLSFLEVAEGHLETKRRMERLETENRVQKEEIEELRQSLRTLRDSLTSGQGVFDPVSTDVPSTGNSEVEGCWVVGTLDQKMTTTQTLEDATEVSTSSAVNAPAWELGGPTAFNVSQAMGVWRHMEVFKGGDRPFPKPCEESIFNLRGSTVERTWRSGDKGETYDDWSVDAESPNQWTVYGWLTWRWVTTDYANWAVLMGCRKKDLSSCFYLLILARERTLPPATLEMLRNVAEHRGFQKADGVPVNQTSC